VLTVTPRGRTSRSLGVREGGAWRWRRDHAAFDLSVAVRAHEDALLRLCTELPQTLPARNAERERFRCRVDVVKVQVDHAAVVAADGTTAAGFLDEDSLDLLQASRDSLARATLAAPPVAALPLAAQMKGDEAMAPADPEVRSAVRSRRPTALPEQGNWCLGRHERMFARPPDVAPAIIPAGPLAQLAERGTSTQKER
jgi:hypothetical protein